MQVMNEKEADIQRGQLRPISECESKITIIRPPWMRPCRYKQVVKEKAELTGTLRKCHSMEAVAEAEMQWSSALTRRGRAARRSQDSEGLR